MNQRRRDRWRAAKVAVAVIGLLGGLAACGSGGGSATSGSGASTASGKPVTIYQITSWPSIASGSAPEQAAAFQAAVDSINATGGVNGQPLKAVICKDDDSINQSQTCAQQALNDPSTVAIVNQYSYVGGPVIDPMFEKAGLADIGIVPITSQDFSCSVCFDLTGGSLTQAIAEPLLLNKVDGAKHIAIVTVQIAAAEQLIQASNAVFKSKVPGGSITGIYIPAGTTDLSPYVAKMQAARDDGVVEFAASYFPTLVETMQQLGLKVPIAGAPQDLKPGTIKAIGSSLPSILFACGLMPTSSDAPGVKAILAGMKKYAPGQPHTALAEEAWTAVQMFAAAARSVSGPVTKASVLKAMNNMRNWDSGGIIPDYSTNTLWSGLGSAAPRVFNPSVVQCKSDTSGNMTAAGSFYSPVR